MVEHKVGSYFFALPHRTLQRGLVRGLLWRIVEDHIHVVIFFIGLGHVGQPHQIRFGWSKNLSVETDNAFATRAFSASWHQWGKPQSTLHAGRLPSLEGI